MNKKSHPLQTALRQAIPADDQVKQLYDALSESQMLLRKVRHTPFVYEETDGHIEDVINKNHELLQQMWDIFLAEESNQEVLPQAG